MKKNLFPQEWLSFTWKERERLVEIFHLKKSGGVIMQDNTMLSDGHSMDDLKKISVESMQEYLGNKTETDFYKLLDLVLVSLKELDKEEEIQKVIDTRELSINRLQTAVNELRMEAIRLGVLDELYWSPGEEIKPEAAPLKVKKGKK